MPVSLRPPWMNAVHLSAPPATRLASMATSTAWLPKARAPCVMSVGSAMAAELSETLSAPAAIIWRMSATVLKPPPTA